MSKPITIVVLAALLSLAEGRVIARPATPFIPILEDIKTELPSGMVMRLPTQSAMDGVQDALYTSVDPYEAGIVRINIHSYPVCTARACQRGYFSTAQSGVEHPMLAYVEQFEIGRAAITLADGVVGNYITVIGVRRPFSIVLWEQDQQTYVVSVPPKYDGSTDAARQRILDFAIPMANEAPIVSD